jgi:hypothetical protein
VLVVSSWAISGLRRRNIDLLRRELQVVEVAVEVAGRVTFKLYPKSKASRRTVPLPDFVIEALSSTSPGYRPSWMSWCSATSVAARCVGCGSRRLIVRVVERQPPGRETRTPLRPSPPFEVRGL